MTFILVMIGEEIYTAVMTHVYPLMKEKFSIEHMSFFVELTTVALDTSRPEFQNIFTFLCLDDKVNPRYVRDSWYYNLFFRIDPFPNVTVSQFQVEFEILVAVVGNEAISCQSLVFRGQLSSNPYSKLVSVMLLIL